MSFVLTRKLASGDKEISRFVDLASQGGYGIIELVWAKVRNSTAKVSGFEIPVDNTNRERKDPNSREVDLSIDVQKISGMTRFFPDNSGRCWGYIIDTDANREKLAATLKTGWFKIVDNKIKEEIVKMAAEKEYPTEPLPKQRYGIKVSKQEQFLKEELEEARRQLDILTKKKSDLEKHLEVANGERKPLEGIRINKAKMEVA